MKPEQHRRKMINADNEEYFMYTGPQRLEKAIHVLEGILSGIAADGTVTTPEIESLRQWLTEHTEVAEYHPFRELIPLVDGILADGVVEEEEANDVLWLCGRFKHGNQYFDAVTSEMQVLQGILAGIMADGEVSKEELDTLSDWMEEHENLKGCWPFDELESLIVAVLRDGHIDQQEQLLLQTFFAEFMELGSNKAVALDELVAPISGLCAVCPEVTWEGKCFCFTGTSQRASRKQLARMVEKVTPHLFAATGGGSGGSSPVAR